MSDTPIQYQATYHVRLHDPAAHLYEVVCRVENPSGDGQLLSFPGWIPGSYLVRDYARHVVRLEAEQRGVAVAARKVDKATWRISSSTGALLIRLVVYAADSSVRGAWLDMRSGFFNGTCLLPRLHGFEDAPVLVHVDPPEGAIEWRLATSFRRLTGEAHDFGAFHANGYADLIDHPVLMGRLELVAFDVAETPHLLAIAGRCEADLERLRLDVQRLCGWHVQLFGGPPPFDRYSFLLRTGPGPCGGLEHAHSAALTCRPDDFPLPEGERMTDGYCRLLGLVSHEYFHAWHVKRIRPMELVDADLSREAYTRQLWIFEGITSYYDDLALARSGLITEARYLMLLGRHITRLYRTPGRRHQTLEEAGFDAWIKFYRPDENSANVTVSYYLKGALVALALDLQIRLHTRGLRSLDDVMRGLWLEYGVDPGGRHGVPEGAFEQAVVEAGGPDVETIFQQSVRGTLDPPLGVLLAQFGVRLNLRAALSASDEGGCRGGGGEPHSAWVGARFRSVEGRLRVSSVVAAGPAQQGGLSAGDELVALDGRRIGPDNHDAMLARLKPDVGVVFHVLRNDELFPVTVHPVEAPRDTCYLTLAEDAAEEIIGRRRAWLSPAPRDDAP